MSEKAVFERKDAEVVEGMMSDWALFGLHCKPPFICAGMLAIRWNGGPNLAVDPTAPVALPHGTEVAAILRAVT